MKNILKYLLLPLLFISILSCDNEDQTLLVVTPSGSGEITAPQTGSKYVLNPEEESTNPALTLTWNAADYGNPTEVKYTVEFAQTGTEFAEPFVAGSTTQLNLSWNISELNGAAVSAGLPPFVEGSLDVRIVSSVGSFDVSPQTSETIVLLITPFTTDLPKISVPGNHQGWDPATAPTLAASAFGATDYIGYAALDGEFKFTAPNDQGNFNWDLNWGDDGSYTGVLLENADNNCKADPASYYLVNADTDELTYSITETVWGIIGAATPTGWDSDTNLTYDADSKTLVIDLDLIAGPFKFRANDDWAIQFGSINDDGYLAPDGDLTFDGPAGNYRVVLDLSNPREYTYSITAN